MAEQENVVLQEQEEVVKDVEGQVVIPGVDVSPNRKRTTYPKLKSLEDIPVSRSQLSYDWMLEYTLENGTPEQAAELLDFIQNHQVERESHLKKLNGLKYKATDIKPMRDLFCSMFFPELRESKTSGKNKESQLDKAIRLLQQKAEQAKAATPKKSPSTRSKKNT